MCPLTDENGQQYCSCAATSGTFPALDMPARFSYHFPFVFCTEIHSSRSLVQLVVIGAHPANCGCVNHCRHLLEIVNKNPASTPPTSTLAYHLTHKLCKVAGLLGLPVKQRLVSALQAAGGANNAASNFQTRASCKTIRSDHNRAMPCW